MAANKRIFHACQQGAIRPDGDASWAAGDEIHGLQNMEINTNFNLSQVFEIGQLAIYQNIEEIPDVEINLTKLLDGYAPIYLKATQDALTPNINGRANSKCIFGAAIFSDTASSASGTPLSEVQSSGSFVNSVSYTFPLEDNATEEVTLVSNQILWANDSEILSGEGISLTLTGQFSGNNDAPLAASGVTRRQHILLTPTAQTDSMGLDSNGMCADPDLTVLPPDVFGVNTTGVNMLSDDSRAKLSSISISCDFNRESINELGRRGPYHRAVAFPVEVTTVVEVTSHSGSLVSATELGIRNTGTNNCSASGNLQDRTIRVATCDGLRVYTGIKNKLQTVGYSGGDAGGGNVTVTYTFVTQNDLTVMHPADPNTNYQWNDRFAYLND